ncbi:MAG: PIG-L family deacetylase, partial [Anaerolineales bacterium]
MDDAALSCGGSLWELAQSGQRAAVWTVCAGDPPPGPLSPFAESLHARWEVGRDAIAERRVEDESSCARLGVSHRHIPIPDCIYREAQEGGPHLYTSEEALFGPLHPAEEELVSRLRELLETELPHGAKLVCPLALGGHVDHRLTRAAAEGLGRPLWFYAEYPYVLQHDGPLVPEGWGSELQPISPPGVRAWQESVAAHASQISTFWPDLEAMRTAIQAYARQLGGVMLFR